MGESPRLRFPGDEFAKGNFGMNNALLDRSCFLPTNNFDTENSRMLSLISFAIFGLIAGAIARLLIPGDQGLGLLSTMLVGIAGSYIGGLIGSLFYGSLALQTSGIIGSVVGAVILLLVISRRKATPMA